jgi:hypothetical protein
MKPQELRIGNNVLHDNVINTVTSIHLDGQLTLLTPQGNYIQSRCDLIHPIYLTENHLIVFGFKRHCGYYKQFELPSDYGATLEILSERSDGTEIVNLLDCDGGKIGTDIKYVHQLQNLYFSITETELKLSK